MPGPAPSSGLGQLLLDRAAPAAPLLHLTGGLLPLEGAAPAAPRLRLTGGLLPSEGAAPAAPRLRSTGELLPLEGAAPAAPLLRVIATRLSQPTLRQVKRPRPEGPFLPQPPDGSGLYLRPVTDMRPSK